MTTQTKIIYTPFQSRNWRIDVDAVQIAWVTLDMAESSTNILSGEVLDELSILLPILEKESLQGAVFRSGKKSGFIAGADIKEFDTFKNIAQARERISRVKPIFQKLANLPFPTVAQINGFCLGGGLELALCCDYRVAEEAPGTKLGLPEVKLGIHPGFGGTVRLPKLIGEIPALTMMLTGKTVDTHRAKKMGLVDWAVPVRHLHRTVTALITRHPPPRGASFMQRLPAFAPFRGVVAMLLKKKTALKAPEDHYPAPHRIIDLWLENASLEDEQKFDAEIDSIADLFLSEPAQNLIRLFHLSERMKGLGKGSGNPGKRLHVIGAGVMGGDIAVWCAINGMTVTLQDSNATMIANTLQRAKQLVQKRRGRSRDIQATLDRLIPDIEGYGVAKADVVIEAIYEDLAAKQKILQAVEPRMKKGAILATNTSSICLEEIATALKEPERFVGIHFFNPVAMMPLVEVVVGKDSSKEAVTAACSFATAIRRSPLPVKSGPGFLINRILMPYLFEGIKMVAEGTKPEAVDRAALKFGMPMGPITLADVVGLDICLSVADILNPQATNSMPHLLHDLVKNGHLGKKTGQGFYHYKQGKKTSSSLAAKDKLPADGSQRLFGAMLNEAVACLSEGVVEDVDLLDAGVVFGTGFAPFRGGPMQHIAQSGKIEWINILNRLQQVHGDRFRPHTGWASITLPKPFLVEERSHEPENVRHNPAVAGKHFTGLVPGAR